MADKSVHLWQMRAVVCSTDMFASKLYGEVARSGGNFVMSPSGVSLLMAMVISQEYSPLIH